MPATITVAAEPDLEDLLGLLRAYCDFYEVAPADADLLALCRALQADPGREGVQLIARDDAGTALGFATVFWSWQTLEARRVGVMNDLYVTPRARGTGLADRLIAACADRAREHGAGTLVWETALDNGRAQAVYERTGAVASRWLTYELALGEPAGGGGAAGSSES